MDLPRDLDKNQNLWDVILKMVEPVDTLLCGRVGWETDLPRDLDEDQNLWDAILEVVEPVGTLL